jgi:hypothetical protein
MDDSSLYKALESIEKEAGQDFNLLLSTGPAYFSTAELLEMRGRLMERQQLFSRFQQSNLWLAALAPSWLVAGFLFGVLGWITPALAAFLLFPLTLAVFLAGLILMRKWFGSKGNLEHIGLLIEMELSRRQKKSLNGGLR